MFFWPMATILVTLIQQTTCKKICLKRIVTFQMQKKTKQFDAASKMVTTCPLHVHACVHKVVISCSEVMLSELVLLDQLEPGFSQSIPF